MNDDETHANVRLTDGLGPLSERRAVVAYLYHDAVSPELADPLFDSTMVVLWRDRNPRLRNETPLVTLAQAEAMVAAERERCAKIVEEYSPGGSYHIRTVLAAEIRKD